MKAISFIALGLVCAPLPCMGKGPAWEYYGTLMTFVDHVGTSGATLIPVRNDLVPASQYTGSTADPRSRLGFGTSNLGVRGSLELDPELSVIWQVENSVSPDGDPPNAIAGRNSCLGLAGKSWGRIFVGNWYTPYTQVLLTLGAQRGLFPFDQTVTANPGFNVPGTVTKGGRVSTDTTLDKSDAAFNRRQGNSLQYWSPEFGGFSLKLAYSFDETKPGTGPSVATGAPRSISPTVWSGMLTWQRGGVMVRYAYERHSDYFGLNAILGNKDFASSRTSRDDGLEMAVYWTIPATGTRVTALVEQLSYRTGDRTATVIKDYSRFAWTTSVQQTFGSNKLWTSYSQACQGRAHFGDDRAAACTGLGARQMAFGYSRALHPNVDVIVSYYMGLNEAAASYSPFPQISTTAVTPGADTRGFGVGMVYTF